MQSPFAGARVLDCRAICIAYAREVRPRAELAQLIDHISCARIERTRTIQRFCPCAGVLDRVTLSVAHTVKFRRATTHLQFGYLSLNALIVRSGTVERLLAGTRILNRRAIRRRYVRKTRCCTNRGQLSKFFLNTRVVGCGSIQRFLPCAYVGYGASLAGTYTTEVWSSSEILKLDQLLRYTGIIRRRAVQGFPAVACVSRNTSLLGRWNQPASFRRVHRRRSIALQRRHRLTQPQQQIGTNFPGNAKSLLSLKSLDGCSCPSAE